MRKNWKKIIGLALAVASSFVLMTSTVWAEAASTPEYSLVEEATLDSVLDTSANLINELISYGDAELDSLAESDYVFTVRAVEAWRSVRDDLGALVSLGEGERERDGDFLTCTFPAEFEKNPGIVRVYWYVNTTTPQASDITFTVEEGKGALMQQAAMNTVIGVGIVFAMLIFLIAVISQFKLVNKAPAPAAPAPQKAPAPAAPKKAPAPAPAAPAPVQDDLELQAVIAAAIAMYEEDTAVSTGDAYTVRPIQRKSSWKRV